MLTSDPANSRKNSAIQSASFQQFCCRRMEDICVERVGGNYHSQPAGFHRIARSTGIRLNTAALRTNDATDAMTVSITNLNSGPHTTG